jgi:hypothetical protein
MNVTVGFSKTVRPATLLNHGHTQALFGDYLFSKNIWSPHYPELTLPDFFLRDHLKERAYNDNPHVDVKKAICAGNKEYHSYNIEIHAVQYAQSCGIVPARE